MKLFEELKRRNVFRIAAGYAIGAWLVLQVTDVLMGILELPSWIGRFTFYALLLGFPLALALSWIFQITPEGLKRDSDLAPVDILNPPTGRKFDLAIIVLLVIALGYFMVDKFVFTQAIDSSPSASLVRHEKSVAVLPFVTSGEEEGGLFATGIHDDLLTQLSKVADLHVISRTSVMEYAQTSKKIPEIGNELGVNHILEGGVQKIGDQVRINAQLIDARLDKHLWAETFDRELTVDSIFKVQSEIVHLITDSLHATLLAKTEASIETPPTDNLDAYRDYLAALHGQSGREVRIEMLQSAVEKDPQFALAWIRMAYEWQQIYWWDPNQPDALVSAEEALAKAEAIDPELPELHRTRALVLYHGYLDHEGALRELERAEEGLPGDSSIFEFRGTVYRHMQRFPEAISAYRKAIALNPRNRFAVYEMGVTLSMVRHFDQERAHWEQAIADFPEFPIAFNWLLASTDWNQYGDSRRQLEVMSRPDWPRYERDDALFALTHWQLGNMSEALRYARQIDPHEEHEVRAFVPTGARMSPLYAEIIKAGLLLAGEADGEAYEILNRARERIQRKIAEAEEPHWLEFAELSGVLSMLRDVEGARAANQAMIEAFDEPEHTYRLESLHLNIFSTMCELGDFSEVEKEIRWILSRPTGQTLGSLVNEWPPCRDRFEGTKQYQRLQEEFGHLSQGIPLE